MLCWTKGTKLNSSTVTNYFVAKSLNFLRQKISSLKVLLRTLLVTKPISSLNVKNSDEIQFIAKSFILISHSTHSFCCFTSHSPDLSFPHSLWSKLPPYLNSPIQLTIAVVATAHSLLWPYHHRQTHDKSSSSFFLPLVSLSNSYSLYLASRLPLFWIGKLESVRIFFSFFPFSSSLLSVFLFWVLGPFGSCLLWVYDLETKEWVFYFCWEWVVCFVVVWLIVLALMGLWLRVYILFYFLGNFLFFFYFLFWVSFNSIMASSKGLWCRI